MDTMVHWKGMQWWCTSSKNARLSSIQMDFVKYNKTKTGAFPPRTSHSHLALL